MSTPEFPIPVHELDAGGKAFRWVIRPEWVRHALEEHEASTSGEPGELEVRASKSGADVVVHGKLSVSLQAPCARCTEAAVFQVEQPISVLFVPGRTSGHEAGSSDDERELSAGEADMMPYDGETVVLDDLVHDELVLETPMIPLCSEDCPGMAQAASTSSAKEPERGVDPRLAPLMRFAKEKKE